MEQRGLLWLLAVSFIQHPPYQHCTGSSVAAPRLPSAPPPPLLSPICRAPPLHRIVGCSASAPCWSSCRSTVQSWGRAAGRPWRRCTTRCAHSGEQGGRGAGNKRGRRCTSPCIHYGEQCLLCQCYMAPPLASIDMLLSVLVDGSSVLGGRSVGGSPILGEGRCCYTNRCL